MYDEGDILASSVSRLLVMNSFSGFSRISTRESPTTSSVCWMQIVGKSAADTCISYFFVDGEEAKQRSYASDVTASYPPLMSDLVH